MSLENNKVLDEYSVWACENEDRNIFPEILKDADSYFKNRMSEETYIMEYSFKTMEELRCGLEKYSGLSVNPEILKKLTITICESQFRRDLTVSKDQNEKNVNSEDKETKRMLPEYVYAF